ncbi:MAG: outer membrane lipoprotein-sorting protein [Deltaproteobacteria bacterium]|nr:outer membrane lipoprotein-sorting protein [Deltaproteobacteria bacterium]MCB9785638.1 outer membrane lipoprotein-sorting protein [Deltaproteobacteria bacterium]
MRSLLTCVCLLTLAPLALADEAPPLPEVARVVDHMDDLYRSKSSEGRVVMKVVTENYQRELTMDVWSKGDDEALVVIRSPAREAGTATLRNDDGLWNYAPRADRLIRIPSGLLSQSWMGSHFSNDDLMRESSYDDDYDASLAWGDRGGQRVLVMTLVPKKEAAVVYTRLVFTMTTEGWLPLSADFYDGDDVVKRMTYSDIGDLGGRKVPKKLVVVPTDKPKESTTVTYEKMSFDGPIDETLFTPRGVRRVAQQR